MPVLRYLILTAGLAWLAWLAPPAWPTARAQAGDAAPLRPGATRPIRPESPANFPRRRSGLWETRSDASESHGLPAARFCVGDDTDNASRQLDRVAGEKGSCSVGSFRRVGLNWMAETVCRDSRQTVISQSVASGDFLSEYRIDTLVFYSPPLPGNKREDRESITARYLGACKPGQRPGDLEMPGMGTLNMNDGTLKP